MKNDLLIISDISVPEQFSIIKQKMEADFPFFKISHGYVNGTATLTTENGGQRFFCIYKGCGEVFLSAGYRTQEGDGAPLPPDFYVPDELDPQLFELLRVIQNGIASVTTKARPPIDAILHRLFFYNKNTKNENDNLDNTNIKNFVFCGDITG
ncbi:MAG: hypothetical protein ACRC2T_20240, partial [Thermoguttaceae bacterium]